MKLPPTLIPRPGESVVWYAEARPVTGIIQGHDIDGLAIVTDGFGLQQRLSFDDIRLEDPFVRRPPNWHELSPQHLVKPEPRTLALLRTVMNQRMPPGPRYKDLVEEIWSRGFEIFLVGGTVRDILADVSPNDIDFVTTMPLKRMLGFVQKMYRTGATGRDERGFIRLGGTPESGDPFIDLKVFSNSLPGTKAATFGVGFSRDVAFRDFACNAVYFDPKNEVIIDPTGFGVQDCRDKSLRLVEGIHDTHQMAQVFIRAIKFVGRGFTLVDDTRERIIEEYLPALAGMKKQIRTRYFVTQVTSKHSLLEAKHQAMADFRSVLASLGCSEAWATYFSDVEQGLK